MIKSTDNFQNESSDFYEMNTIFAQDYQHYVQTIPPTAFILF